MKWKTERILFYTAKKLYFMSFVTIIASYHSISQFEILFII